jgi:hypothetical protein
MPSDQRREVTVVAHLPRGMRVAEGALLRARVEDVSVADRRPATIGNVTMPMDHVPEDGRVEISVPVEDVDRQASYSVFVHLDVSGSGEVDVGDAITTSSHPILTHGGTDRAEVQLQRVGGASADEEL